MELTLVRHGESESNVRGTWQGQSNSNLSDEGNTQAKRLGERFVLELESGKVDLFDHIVCSDLTRCVQTAQALPWKHVLDPRWREIDLGQWEGLPYAETAERFPEEVQALIAGSDTTKIGGGESWADLRTRVRTAADELQASMGHNARVLVVTHGGVIHSLVCSILGMPETRPKKLGKVANTSVTVLDYNHTQPQVLRFNDTSHLDRKSP